MPKKPSTPRPSLQVARVYIRVSTSDQDLRRQESIIESAKVAGYYVAAVYKEAASGARADRPELLRMIADLQPGEVVIAERMDRISRLPLAEAERLVQVIRDRGARLAVPDVVDLSDLVSTSQGVAKIVLEAVQEMLLRLALQMARDEYEMRQERQRQGIIRAKAEGRYTGRAPNRALAMKIIELRTRNTSIQDTARIVGCHRSTVTRIWTAHLRSQRR
jgi:DNA invertase Pin-like site-specific DNA recombinase